MKQLNQSTRCALTILLILAVCISFGTTITTKSAKEELDAAKKAKKTVFLVVTGTGIKTENMEKIAQQAHNLLKESMVLSLNRDDKSNAELTSKLGLGSMPLPFILVIGMNGLPAGGLQEKEVSADKLVQMAPSPKKAEALAYLIDKKPVFVIGYKKSFTDRSKALESCKAAITLLKGNAAFVEVDMDDPKEKILLDQIGADLKAKSTVIVVANAQGKITGNFVGLPDVHKLVTAATTQPKSCCAPGSGKTCGK